ncbi:hypothetical protein CONLIGDRAFT_703209 [Coniochaeta ligniaria NRRL 30616]|uniref:Uncharacterized protein n=1 Tax=Coniochaeta ligniaria NRRL 30616 TaxID=1408157 RepID=A0A1J7IL66_9PEZI|nr:hypothetical protein CONLIGDRAFT_703209 [Coniochaeta ligniaria NRRL 30616]
MSHNQGLKAIFAGLRKKSDNDGEQSTSTASPKLDKTSATGTSGGLATREEMSTPERTLKRKETVIFNPIQPKGKGKATVALAPSSPSYSFGASSLSSPASTVKDLPTSPSYSVGSASPPSTADQIPASKGKDVAASPSDSVGSSSLSSTADKIRASKGKDVAASPSHSVGSSSLSSTASTISEPMANRPGVHFFCHESRALHGDPKTGKETGDIILAGFNDDQSYDDLIRTDPSTTYKVPRLHIASVEELREGGGVTARMASQYVQQIKRGVPDGNRRGGAGSQSDVVVPRQTMGMMNTKNGDQKYFMLGPNDLIVFEPLAIHWRDQVNPWACNGENVYPFAHNGHFGRTPLMHFAWEWLRYTDKFVSRPVPAVPGVHIWLIDYELRRGVKQERKTEAQGHRHVFYGRGCRYVEVQRQDKEWNDGRKPGDRAALMQVKLWEQRREQDVYTEHTYNSYNWPTVGVLACEIGDY